jgi:hypothetical protein
VVYVIKSPSPADTRLSERALIARRRRCQDARAMTDEPPSPESRARYRGLIFRSGQHGQYVITREAVEGMLEQLQAQPVPMNVEHDPTRVPVGRVIGGRLRELEDGEIGLEADMELFDSSTSALILPARDFGKALQSLAPIAPEPDSLELAFDDRSYAAADVAGLQDIASEVGDAVSSPPLARFSQLPDALLIIALGTPTAAAWWFMRGFFTKAGEAAGTKVGEALGDDAVSAYRAFKRHVREMVSTRRTPADTPPITMLTLVIPRQHGGVVAVEGSTRADDEALDHFLDAGDELLAIALTHAALVSHPDRLATLHFTYSSRGWQFAYGLDDAAELVMLAFLPDDEYDRALDELSGGRDPSSEKPPAQDTP